MIKQRNGKIISIYSRIKNWQIHCSESILGTLRWWHRKRITRIFDISTFFRALRFRPVRISDVPSNYLNFNATFLMSYNTDRLNFFSLTFFSANLLRKLTRNWMFFFMAENLMLKAFGSTCGEKIDRKNFFFCFIYALTSNGASSNSSITR